VRNGLRNAVVTSIAALTLSLWFAALPAAAEVGLVARWDFDEGQGDVLHDRSGNGNHGKIHGAQWVRVGDGYALKFDGVDDYVDCGNGPSLDITGPISVEAWVYLGSAPEKGQAGIVGKYYDSYLLNYHANGRVHWHLRGNNYRRSSQLDSGLWYHLVGVFDSREDVSIASMGVYVNGLALHGRETIFDHVGHSKYKTLNHGKNFLMGCAVRDPSREDPSKASIPHFRGLIDEVRVYSRALSEAEIARNFNERAEERGRPLLDTSRFTRFSLAPPCFYFAEKEFDVSVDFWGLMPLPRGSEMVVTLARPGAADPLQSCKVAPWPGKERGDIRRTYSNATFSLSGLAPGKYEVRAVLRDKGRDRSPETLVFQYPPRPPEVPSPAAKVVGPLQSSPGTVAYDFELCDGGGFRVLVNGESHPVESTFSYPHGGENALLASSEKAPQSEPSWTVTTRRVGTKAYEVVGRGRHYAVERRIELHPNHISVTDTIQNLTDKDIGIIVNNYLDLEKHFPTCYLGGVPGRGRRHAIHNPTAFVARKGLGLGLVAMDDVYVVQGSLYGDEYGRTGILDDRFGLGPNASYAMSWSIYPVGSDDYFDLINVLRRDLGLNGKTVDGSLTCMAKYDHTSTLENKHHPHPIPEPEQLPRGLRPKYISLDSLVWIADDPEITIQGFEFIDFPKERAYVRRILAEIRAKYPDAYPMFHIAPSLYTTNRPERYADSRVIDRNGRQCFWGDKEGKWISKERQAAGWRYWAFYPTMDNSYGKAMLRSIDVMMDEMGAAGVFADGVMLGYGAGATYDRWDGHTVEIDPETKTVQRKYGLVQLLSQEAFLEWCRRITSRGGAVIMDSGPGTLTFARNAECATYALESNVNNSCKWVHLAPFPVTLSRTCQFPAPTVYQDILTKLHEGVLWYDYYSRVGRLSIYSRFYPITIEEIHSGFVKGKEKLVTCLSGVYGWAGDRDLHFVDLSDGRGILVPHRFVTTVDSSGVRTQLTLGKDEIAVLKKIPVNIQSENPVNLIVQQYDAEGVSLTLNGLGEVRIAVRSGEFAVAPDATYSLHVETSKQLARGENGTVSFVVHMNGQRTVSIQKAQ